MGAAAYIGRVGGLAVALGVGTAIVTGHGVASADDATSNQPSSDTSPTSGTTDTKTNTTTTTGTKTEVNKVLSREDLSELMKLVREVPVASHVKDYAVRLVLATHPKTDTAAPIANQYLRFGSSPRGAQVLVLAAKVRALAQGRFNVSFDDIAAVATPAIPTNRPAVARPVSAPSVERPQPRTVAQRPHFVASMYQRNAAL